MERRAGLVIAPSGVGEVLDLGFNLARRNYRLLLVIGAWGIVPSDVVRAAASLSGIASGSTEARIVLEVLGTLISVAGSAVAEVAVMLAGTRLIAPPGTEHDLAPGELYRAALVGVLRLVWLGLVVGLLAVPLLILFPLGIFLMVRWSQSWIITVVERTGPGTALRRSWQLTRGSWWHTFFAVFAISMIIGVLTYALTAVAGGAALLIGFVFGSDAAGTAFGILGSLLANLLLTPFNMAVLVVLYYELRARAEGFDLEQRAQLAAASA